MLVRTGVWGEDVHERESFRVKVEVRIRVRIRVVVRVGVGYRVLVRASDRAGVKHTSVTATTRIGVR